MLRQLLRRLEDAYAARRQRQREDHEIVAERRSGPVEPAARPGVVATGDGHALVADSEPELHLARLGELGAVEGVGGPHGDGTRWVFHGEEEHRTGGLIAFRAAEVGARHRDLVGGRRGGHRESYAEGECPSTVAHSPATIRDLRCLATVA